MSICGLFAVAELVEASPLDRLRDRTERQASVPDAVRLSKSHLSMLRPLDRLGDRRSLSSVEAPGAYPDFYYLQQRTDLAESRLRFIAV